MTPPAPGKTKWTKTTLLRFTGGVDGAKPYGKLLLGPAGVLYGVSYKGGTGQCLDGFSNHMGCGVVYKLTPPPSGRTTWSRSTLLNFDGAHGQSPEGGLIRDTAGNLTARPAGAGSGTQAWCSS